jgi:hypothetical protein
VTVFTPAPGGGTSATLAFTITPPPTLTVSAPAVALGGTETVTVTNGLGGSTDWLALAATGSPNSSYLQWTYIGAGMTMRTWTVTMPTTPGTYEFRLFPNNGYTRAATSPTVTVAAPPAPVPVVSSLSPAGAAAGGSAFTLTVTGSGFVASSVVRWNGATRPTTVVNGNQIQAAIGAGDIAVLGTAQVTVFTPPPAGGISSSLTFTVSPPPSLTVSATSVAGGTSVTATLTNGYGGSGDWLALAATSSPNTSYLQYTYVGSGVTTRSWTVTMPTTSGTYEFRLFPNNGYSRAATSVPVTVVGLPPSLAVNATSVGGGSSVTMTLTNGLGGAADWLALAATGSPSTSYLQYTYVGSGITTRMWTVTMPTTAGTYEFRLFPNNGYTVAATSPAVTVTQ